METAQLISRGSGVWGVQGRLTFATVPAMVNRFADMMNGNNGVIVDLRQVERADSAGLAMLVEWAMQAEHKGARVTFSNMPIQILAMARVSGLDEILPIQN